jgi:flagellar hook-associated protein 2
MAGTISLNGLGIGSGLDTDGIVTALVNVEKQGENALQSKVTATNASISNLSSVSSLLAKLKAASDALDTSSEVGSYKASSSNAAIVASASGNATPGKYSIKVNQLAQEQRNYSNTISSSTAAMGQSGTLRLSVGTGTATDISISATDTIDDVMGKINSAGLRVSASSFYDGKDYRIQLRGLDTGAANNVNITELGTAFGFNDTGNAAQQAQDAEIEIDKFKVKSATNLVTGAVRGVTLALTATTTDAVTVGVDNDTDGMKTKLQALVDAYNAVSTKIKGLSGTVGAAATDPNLAGDFTLRSIGTRLNAALHTQVGTGTYNTLASIGLSMDKTGKLALDSDKLNKAIAADSSSVTKLLAGTDGGALGVMDKVYSTVDLYTRTGTGLLAGRTEAMQAQVKRLQKKIDSEDVRINRYADQLRKQFTAMDTNVAQTNSLSTYLAKLG